MTAKLRAALELADGLDFGDHDRLIFLIERVDDEPELELELREILGFNDHAELVAWLDLARGPLLERHAYEMNRCEDAYGDPSATWIVAGTRVVVDGGLEHRELQRRALRLPAATGRPHARSRGRAPRGRRTRTTRTSSSPGRPADDEPDPARPGGRRGVEAAA